VHVGFANPSLLWLAVDCGLCRGEDSTKVPIPILELMINLSKLAPTCSHTFSINSLGKLLFRGAPSGGPELEGRLEAGVRQLTGRSVNTCRSLAPAQNMRLKSRWQKVVVAHDYGREKYRE
jgi:hypothetical protein